MLEHHKTDECICPHCSSKLDMHSRVTGESEFSPKEGDVSLCIYCKEILIFTKDLNLRKSTLEDLKAMPMEMLTDLLLSKLLIDKVKRQHADISPPVMH